MTLILRAILFACYGFQHIYLLASVSGHCGETRVEGG